MTCVLDKNNWLIWPFFLLFFLFIPPFFCIICHKFHVNQVTKMLEEIAPLN